MKLTFLLFALLGLVVDAKPKKKAKAPKEEIQAEELTPTQAAIKAAKKGDYESARSLALGMIEQDEKDPFPWQLLSQVSLMEGNHEKSLEEAQKAENLAPTDPMFKSTRMFHEAILEQDKQNLPAALSLFKESVETLEHKDVRSLEKTIIAVAALGDIPAAVGYLKQLWAASPMYEFHNQLPFVRIVDEYEDMVEAATRKGTLSELNQQLSNITTITDTIFFDVSVNGQTERVEIGLYGHACPVAVANLKGLAACEKKDRCYKGTGFHRVIKDFIVQGGDITPGDGTGRVNIYNRPFADEVFAMALMHSGPGVVQMANSGADSNGGQFVIMVQAAAHLNGAHVVVGKVLKGMGTVVAMNSVPVDVETYRPNTKLTVTDCGVL